MSNVVLLGFICLSCKVFITGCEVVWVNRNVTDSFCVGKDGCTNNTSVCPSSSTCQTGSGLCLCRDSQPSFINPNGKLGCFSKLVLVSTYIGSGLNIAVVNIKTLFYILFYEVH